MPSVAGIKKRILAWTLGAFAAPPLMWLAATWYFEIFNLQQLLVIAFSPLLSAYVLVYIGAVLGLTSYHLHKIEACLALSSPDNIIQAQRSLRFVPYAFLVEIVIYCLCGPNSALIGKDFIDNTKYFLDWVFGIPIIFTVSIPFFLAIVSNLEKISQGIPTSTEQKFLSLSRKMIYIFVFNSIGAGLTLPIGCLALIYCSGSPDLFGLVAIKLVGAGIFLALIVALNLMLVVRDILGPIRSIASATLRLAGGEPVLELKSLGRRDELGDIVASLTAFAELTGERNKLAEREERARAEAQAVQQRSEVERHASEAEQTLVVQTLAANLSRLAQGDLTARVEREFVGPYAQIKEDFNATAESLGGAMAAIANATATIQGGADELTAAADELSQRTEQQAANLEETVSAMGEITNRVRATAEGSAQANTVVASAKVEVEKGGEIVLGAIAAMGEIETSAGKISQIIGVIDEIAFQTNLLALNAGVEAARAGDAGRGFAVVASEVRALAQRSAGAAKDIKALISASSKQVEHGVDLVGQTGRALERMMAGVAQLSFLIADISATSRDQAASLAEVNGALGQMDQVTQQNVAMVEESKAATLSLEGAAANLATLVARFKTGAGQISSRAATKAPSLALPPMASPARALQRRAANGMGATAQATDSWERL